MDLTILNWAVLELTGSAYHLGIINACRLLPVFVFSMPAGVIADRFDRRKTIFGLQLCMMIMTIVLGYAFWAQSSFSVLATLVATRACFSSALVPIRSVYSTNLVSVDSIKSAAAVHATTMNLARIGGPAAAGYLLLVLPVYSLFYINSLTFLIAIGSLIGLEEVSSQVKSKFTKNRDLTREIWQYVKANKSIRSLIVLSTVPMVFGFPYATLMPIVVKDILGAGAFELGMLLSAAALGAAMASIFLSIDRRHVLLGMQMLGSIVLFGVSLALLSCVQHFWQAAVLLTCVGFFSQVYRTTNRTAFLLTVPDELRGRVMSVAMLDRGLIPLGTVLVVSLIEITSIEFGTFAMGGMCVLLVALVLLVDRSVLAIR